VLEYLRAVKEQVLQGTIDEAVTAALGERRGARLKGTAPWPCPSCGPRRGDQLRRNGHYRRQVVVLEGVLTVKMPQVVCVDCHRSVAIQHPLLPRRQRLWLDLHQRVAEAYLEGCSYRATRRLLEREAATNIGLMSTWRLFQAVGRGEHAVPERPQARYLALDEVYQKVRGEGRWFLCARAVDARGGLHWVGFAQSSERSQEAWEAALDELGLSRLPPALRCHDGRRPCP